jgi:hypothetical protein
MKKLLFLSLILLLSLSSLKAGVTVLDIQGRPVSVVTEAELKNEIAHADKMGNLLSEARLDIANFQAKLAKFDSLEWRLNQEKDHVDRLGNLLSEARLDITRIQEKLGTAGAGSASASSGSK